jgi:hypothetical protein
LKKNSQKNFQKYLYLQVIEDTPASRKGKGGGGGRKRRDDGEIRSSDESGGEGGAPGTCGHKEGGKKRSSKKAGGRVGKKTFFYHPVSRKMRNLVNSWRTFVDAKYFVKMSAFPR